MPRSLNEPVGFKPSYLKYNSVPAGKSFTSETDRIKGVLPSFNETTGVWDEMGKYSRYSSSSPRQSVVVFKAFTMKS
jgi:hypothetical protein